jgi:hypothetical protein
MEELYFGNLAMAFVEFQVEKITKRGGMWVALLANISRLNLDTIQ